MESKISEEVKDTELFMIAQFVDVKKRKRIYLEYIRKMSESKNFLSLNLYNKKIDKKIEKCKEIHSTNVEYKETLKKLEKRYKNLIQKLNQNNKDELEEIKKLIYDVCNFDVYLAYKIGLVDGLKIKSKCT